MPDNGKKTFKIEKWVNTRLTDADKEHLSEIGVDWSAIFDWMGQRLYEGYRFSITWDDYSDAAQVSIMCKSDQNPNYGLAISSRHPDLDMALMSLYYKDTAILQGDWTQEPESPTRSKWD